MKKKYRLLYMTDGVIRQMDNDFPNNCVVTKDRKPIFLCNERQCKPNQSYKIIPPFVEIEECDFYYTSPCEVIMSISLDKLLSDTFNTNSKQQTNTIECTCTSRDLFLHGCTCEYSRSRNNHE